MTGIPSDPGVIVIGSCLRDPDQFWGEGALVHDASLPPRSCDLCGGTGWVAVPDPVLGDTLDARCPTCGGTT
jgi:rubredoxin